MVHRKRYKEFLIDTLIKLSQIILTSFVISQILLKQVHIVLLAIGVFLCVFFGTWAGKIAWDMEE